jgi:hypothetical protein
LLTPRARANPTPVAPTISKISKVSSPDPGRGPTLKTLKLGRHTTSSKLKSCTQATGRTRNSENFTIRGGCRHFQSFQSCIPAKGGTLNSDNLKISGGDATVFRVFKVASLPRVAFETLKTLKCVWATTVFRVCRVESRRMVGHKPLNTL